MKKTIKIVIFILLSVITLYSRADNIILETSNGNLTFNFLELRRIDLTDRNNICFIGKNNKTLLSGLNAQNIKLDFTQSNQNAVLLVNEKKIKERNIQMKYLQNGRIVLKKDDGSVISITGVRIK